MPERKFGGDIILTADDFQINFNIIIIINYCSKFRRYPRFKFKLMHKHPYILFQKYGTNQCMLKHWLKHKCMLLYTLYSGTGSD